MFFFLFGYWLHHHFLLFHALTSSTYFSHALVCSTACDLANLQVNEFFLCFNFFSFLDFCLCVIFHHLHVVVWIQRLCVLFYFCIFLFLLALASRMLCMCLVCAKFLPSHLCSTPHTQVGTAAASHLLYSFCDLLLSRNTVIASLWDLLPLLLFLLWTCLATTFVRRFTNIFCCLPRV